MTLLFRASTRFLLRHRLQCALALSGIALGVAIVVGIQVTQHSARAAFDASLAGVQGSTTHTVISREGVFPTRYLATVRRALPRWQPQPIVRGRVRFDSGDTVRSLHLLGIDPLALHGDTFGDGVDVGALMRSPGAIVVSQHTATALGLHGGQTLTVSVAAQTRELHVLAVLPTHDATGNLFAENVLIADIATAQETLGLQDGLTSIELTAPASALSAAPAAASGTTDTAGELAALAASLPPVFTISSKAGERASADQITQAFYTNLDALSLLALLVGGFMIYNTMAFLVIQRQTLYSRLRALGVTTAAIIRQVATEAVVLGLIGGLLGNALGYALARVLMQPMSQTLSDHYHDTTGGAAQLTPGLVLFGFGLAVLTSLLASLPPAYTAARAAPAGGSSTSIRESMAVIVHARCAWAGCLMFVACGGLLTLSDRSLYAGFAALGCLLVGATLLSPFLLQRLLAVFNGVLATRLPLPERLAARSAARAMNRLGMAVAALLAATATSIGVALMVDSFRAAVDDWLAQLLRADIYVSTVSADTAGALDPTVYPLLHAEKRVAALSRVRRLTVEDNGAVRRVTAYDLPPTARAGFHFIAGEPASAWRQWDAGEAALVSEPYAWHQHVRVGDDIRLPTAAGVRTFAVAGIYRDYASEHGVVALNWQTYARYWREQSPHSVGVYVHPGTDITALRADLERMWAGHDELIVWTDKEIRRQSMAVFDRTFAITHVLTLLAAIIAALGVFNALMALNMERAREYSILRAVGAPVGLLRRMLHAQTLIIAACAVLLAVPLGSLIAMVLIEIINVRSFGWSMPFHWHGSALWLPLMLAFGGALAASVYPAEATVRTQPAQALRFE